MKFDKENLPAKKPYQKACMQIVEIDVEDVVRTSGLQPQPQINNFKKQGTDDWF
ncbi:MAG: hypothetical protein HUK19_03355 [Fibrobacter sp.]|nr:hypothetical protein [Fibrobacter sp.]